MDETGNDVRWRFQLHSVPGTYRKGANQHLPLLRERAKLPFRIGERLLDGLVTPLFDFEYCACA